ncbi:MAG: hypothetical protein K9J83_01095 [Desulfarculaceae bacterium]|nr:hypothetical protein [Desulfarculaceae bacterium]
MSGERKEALETLCSRIAESQEKLIRKAEDEMIYCTEKCRGLCCKNLDLDTIFTLWDFIFILVARAEMETVITGQLEEMPAQSPSPCPFLRNREGPCIFPAFVKPQLCVVTFCCGEERIKEEIRRVNRDFLLLCFAAQKARIANVLRHAWRPA